MCKKLTHINILIAVGLFAGYHLYGDFVGLLGGALVGAILAQFHILFLQTYLNRGRWTTDLYYLVVSLHAKCAKADGVVTPEEIRAFREVVDIDSQYGQMSCRVFDDVRKTVKGYEAIAQRSNDHLTD